MRLYVMRHGESEANRDKRSSGWSQVPLTNLGVEQAKKTGELMRDIRIDRIFCSDLLRAKQTAELIFPGREYVEDARLRELNVGVLTGHFWTENDARYGDELKAAQIRMDYRPFGGEHGDEQVARVAEFMDSLADCSDEENIAVVCHWGTVFSILRYVLQVPMDRNHVEIANAGVSCFTRTNGVWKLVGWNITEKGIV